MSPRDGLNHLGIRSQKQVVPLISIMLGRDKLLKKIYLRLKTDICDALLQIGLQNISQKMVNRSQNKPLF